MDAAITAIINTGINNIRNVKNSFFILIVGKIMEKNKFNPTRQIVKETENLFKIVVISGLWGNKYEKKMQRVKIAAEIPINKKVIF